MINTVFIERILNINCIVYLFTKTKALCDRDPPPLCQGASPARVMTASMDGDSGLSPAWPWALNRVTSLLGGSLCQKLGCHLYSFVFSQQVWLPDNIHRKTKPRADLSGCTWTRAAPSRQDQAIRNQQSTRLQKANPPSVALTQGLPLAKTLLLLYSPDHQGQLTLCAKSARVLPSGNIPVYFRNWTVGINQSINTAFYQNTIKKRKKDQKLGKQSLPSERAGVDSIACKTGLEDFNPYRVNI